MKYLYFVCSLLLFSFYITKEDKKEIINKEILPSRTINQLSHHVGQIKKFTGQVFVNKNLITKPSFKLNEADIIETKNKSFVQLIMNDNTIINLASNSSIKLDRYKVFATNEREISIKLINGLIKTHFRNKNKNGTMKVYTKQASMGIRGTEFITSYNDQNGTEVYLIEGLVHSIHNETKESYNMVAGDVLNIIDNKLIISKKSVQKLIQIKQQFDTNLIENQESFIELLETEKTEENDVSNSVILNMTNSMALNLNKDNKKESKYELKTIDSPSTQSVLKVNNQSSIIDTYKLYENKIKFNELSSEKKAEIISQIIENNENNVKTINERKLVNPLITPDNKVVFFDDHPELLKLLPKDNNGQIIGIKVDFDHVPINVIDAEESYNSRTIASIDNDQDEDDMPIINNSNNSTIINKIENAVVNTSNSANNDLTNNQTIQIVNKNGEIEQMPIVLPNDSVLIVPTTQEGIPTGIIPSIIKKIGL